LVVGVGPTGALKGESGAGEAGETTRAGATVNGLIQPNLGAVTGGRYR
jgi:hypothetical protein